jgi:hypothetical protein
VLEFIVLGKIPGTPLQITLAWFVFAILGLLIWADIKFHVHKNAQNNKKTVTKKTRKPSQAKA